MLEQAAAEHYISVPKIKKDNTIYILNSGMKITIPLISSESSSEEFLLDIHKHNINLFKYTFQNRVRKSVGLIRVDLEGPPHKNPDGIVLMGPHLHYYREGFDLKWAYPLPFTLFGKNFNLSLDFNQNLATFLDLCNVTQPPTIQMSLI